MRYLKQELDRELHYDTMDNHNQSTLIKTLYNYSSYNDITQLDFNEMLANHIRAITKVNWGIE